MNLLVFGATGLCGRAVMERALELEEVQTVTAFVRNESRAREMFSKFDHSSKILYQEGDIYKVEHVRNAVCKADAIISCIASYTKPHTQMSALAENVLDALKYTNHKVFYIHFGMPRGYGPSGTLIENSIMKLVILTVCTKYSPATKDHIRVQNLLKESENGKHENLDYSLFAAPSMVDKPPGQKDYFGKDGTVSEAVEKSRVWHFLSTHDVAYLMLSHLAMYCN